MTTGFLPKAGLHADPDDAALLVDALQKFLRGLVAWEKSGAALAAEDAGPDRRDVQEMEFYLLDGEDFGFVVDEEADNAQRIGDFLDRAVISPNTATLAT